MRNGNARDAELYRPLKAVAVMLAIVVAAPGADVVLRFVAGPHEAHSAHALEAGISASQLIDAGDAFGTLDRMEAVVEPRASGVEDSFYREVGLLAGARDARASPEGDVVGYVVDGQCADVLDRLTSHMEERGWTAVSLEGSQGATFVKASGACTWVLATCTQAGEATSVVMRSVTR